MLFRLQEVCQANEASPTLQMIAERTVQYHAQVQEGCFGLKVEILEVY
jgi:hypothetical protein